MDPVTTWFTGMDYAPILTEIKDVAKVAIPVVIGFIAFRKGYSFLKSQLKGA